MAVFYSEFLHDFIRYWRVLSALFLVIGNVYTVLAVTFAWFVCGIKGLYTFLEGCIWWWCHL
jgi:hypothetical protein